MERKFKFAVGEYYHVYNRGSDKRNIFLNDHDRERFLKLLYFTNGTKPLHFADIPRGEPSWGKLDRGESLTSIGAYCLMPNHFHLLIREKRENGISKFMLKLTTAYAMYFNTKRNRSGNLFQGAFKAMAVNNDDHLKYLFAYIHLNPIKLIQSKWAEEGLKNKTAAQNHLRNYQYSSYHEYIGQVRPDQQNILQRTDFPEYFEGPKEFNGFVLDWLNYNDHEGNPRGWETV